MTDLVKRLRGGLPCGDVKCFERSAVGGCTCGEAAYRIEQLESGQEEWHRICNSYAARIDELEAALRELSTDWDCCAVSKNMKLIARKALEGKDA